MNFDILVGKTEQEAMEICKNNGYTLRVVVKDGQHLMVTADLRSDRIDVETLNGVIIGLCGDPWLNHKIEPPPPEAAMFGRQPSHVEPFDQKKFNQTLESHNNNWQK